MKNKQMQAIRLLIVTMALLFTAACVNSIHDEVSVLMQGDIPIKLSSNILCLQSRANNSKFEIDDAIGFYAVAESQSIAQTRYIDNMCFTCTSKGLVPDEPVFYPAGNEKCNFISYYPYQEEGIAENASTIEVAIKANQSSHSEYTLSDFMAAQVAGVSSTTNSVKLDFQHKLSQLNIILQLTDNHNMQEVEENATVFISNAYIKATYDFNTDAFSSLNTVQEVTPYGEWVVNESTKRLTGKKMLLIPQSAGKCKISLRINGRTFTSPLPEELILACNKSSEVILHYDPKLGLSKLELVICEWQEGNSKDVVLEEEKEANSLRLAELNFEQTGVYQIKTKSDEVIAEVCREYLLGANVDNQAIVLYPTTSKNQGLVLQLLNISENLHGGSVTWDYIDNSFTYVPGNSAPLTTLYIDSGGKVVYEEPADPQIIIVSASKLVDARGAESNSYPIVKIGTQYWMAENLKAGKYNDGSPITQIADMTKTTAGYYVKDNNRFYNAAAVTKGLLAPKGWKIPSKAEWEILKKYVNNESSVLKSDVQWVSSVDINKANNKSGFNAQPIGFFNRKENGGTFSSAHAYKGNYIMCWSTDYSQTSLAEKSVCLRFDSNVVGAAVYNDYSGYSIRCIKE